MHKVYWSEWPALRTIFVDFQLKPQLKLYPKASFFNLEYLKNEAPNQNLPTIAFSLESNKEFEFRSNLEIFQWRRKWGAKVSQPPQPLRHWTILLNTGTVILWIFIHDRSSQNFIQIGWTGWKQYQKNDFLYSTLKSSISVIMRSRTKLFRKSPVLLRFSVYP